MATEQHEKALAAVRRYLPPQHLQRDSSGYNILTGATVHSARPAASIHPGSPAATFGAFGRKETVSHVIGNPGRPRGDVTIKQSAKSRNHEDWVSDLAEAGAGRRYGRRSPMRRRPPAVDGAQPPQSRGRRADPELHGYRREPVVTDVDARRGVKASDITEPVFFAPRFSPPRERPPAQGDGAAAAEPAGARARRQGAGSEWPKPVDEAVSTLMNDPAAAPVPAAQPAASEPELKADRPAPQPDPPQPDPVPEAAAGSAAPTAPSDTLVSAASLKERGSPAPAAASPRPATAAPTTGSAVAPEAAIGSPGAAGARRSSSPGAAGSATPGSSSRRPQSARRSESMHVERLLKARDLAKAPPAGAPVMENTRPKVSSRRGVSPGGAGGVLLASQWDGRGMAFATGSDASRPSRRVEYVTAAQESQEAARDQLKKKGGERTVWNAPPVPQQPSSASLRRRNSMPGFLADGSSTRPEDTCEYSVANFLTGPAVRTSLV